MNALIVSPRRRRNYNNRIVASKEHSIEIGPENFRAIALGNRLIMIGGDLIVAIDGEPVSDQTDIANVMDKHHAGDTVTVSIFRGKRKMDVKVTLQEEGRQVV